MWGAVTVFVSGLSIMVLELIAGRLVAPYFGQSTCTWAALTGVTLAGVSIGNAFGGWISDRAKRPIHIAAAALLIGGILCAALPFVLPLLGRLTSSITGFEARAALFVTVAWLPPMLALGCVSPSVAAQFVRAENNGRDIGLLYLASMIGSGVGSVLGGLFLPFMWPADSLYCVFGLILLVLALIIGTIFCRSTKKETLPNGAFTTGPADVSSNKTAYLFLAVFVVGWFGMGIELAGAKLVTPILGGNHIVWSLIFITFITMMGIGGWLGGVLADRKPRVELAVISLCVLGFVSCLTVWAQTSLLPGILMEAGAIERLLGFTLFAFTPLAIILGATSTILLKFATANALRNGKKSVIGFMYATASAGSVCGTFVTGFALVGKIGTVSLCMLLVVSLIVIAALLSREFKVVKCDNSVMYWSGVFFTCLIVGATYFHFCGRIQIPLEVKDDPDWRLLSVSESRYNLVTVSALKDSPDTRTIWLDRIPHTSIDINRPDYLHTSYTRMIDEVVMSLIDRLDKPSLFMIGGGGYALPRKWTAGKIDWRRLVVAEIDKAVTDAAVKYLDAMPKNSAGVSYITGDGRRVLDDLLDEGEDGKFDIVVGDTISDSAIPYHLITREFNERTKRLLKPDGVYVIHLLDALDNPSLLSSVVKTLSTSWKHVSAVAYQQVKDVRQSFVVVASDKASKIDGESFVKAIAKRYPESWPITFNEAEIKGLISGKDALLLSDRFAPMEKFVWEVVFKNSDKSVMSDTEEAMRLLKDEESKDAYEIIARIFKTVPEFPEAIIALRYYLELFQDDTKALDLLRKQAERKSAGFIAQSAYASILVQKKDYVQAEKVLGLLYKRFPARIDFAKGWAINASKAGKRDEAVKWVNDNIHILGDFEHAQLLKAVKGETE